MCSKAFNMESTTRLEALHSAHVLSGYITNSNVPDDTCYFSIYIGLQLFTSLLENTLTANKFVFLVDLIIQMLLQFIICMYFPISIFHSLVPPADAGVQRSQ